MESKDFIQKVLLNHACFKARQGHYKQESECYYARNFNNPTGFGYIYVNNESEKALHEIFNFTGSEGIQMMAPFKWPVSRYIVPSMHEAIIVFKILKKVVTLKSKVNSVFKEVKRRR